MTMKARTHTDSQGNISIYLEGGLSFENIAQFRKKLVLLLESNPKSMITLDLYKLDFVGSSGIGFFAESIKEISQQFSRLKISNTKSEFFKIFKIYGIDQLDILTDNSEIIDSPHLREKNIF